MKLSRYILFLILIFHSVIGYCEEPENGDLDETFWGKTYFGGNIQLAFGNFTIVNLSPIMGYKLSKTSSIGIGPVYEYYGNSFSKTHVYGGRIIGKQLIYERFLAQAEYENLFIKSVSGNRTNTRELQRFLVGGGYREHLGGKVYAEIIILWDVTHSNRSLSTSPMVFRGGITVGL